MMTPSATPSVEGTPTRKLSSSPSLLPSEGTATSDGSDKDAHDKNNEVPRSSEMPITARSSSSSLSEMESTDGVAGEGDIDDENNFGFNPELKNCWKVAAVASASSLTAAAAELGERSVCDDDINDDENSRGRHRDGSEQKRCENLAQIRVDFKDPFPCLTPMPSPTPSRQSLTSSYNRLNAQTAAQHSIQDHLRTPLLWTTPSKSTQHNQHISQSSNTCSSSSNTTPYTPCVPQMPTLSSRANTPQPLSMPITPINTACNNIQRLWIDPFPTPDASVASRHGTPCSSRVQPDNDDLDGDTYGKIMNNGEWDTILQALPQIPPIEELSTSASEDERTKRRNIVNISCPRLHSMDAAELTVRKVSSESNLPLMKRPSMEDIWGALESALESGPDGNELVTKYNHEKAERREKKERRISEKGMNWSEPLEYQRSDKPLRQRRQEQTFQRSLTAPVETSWEGLRRRPLNHLVINENSGSDIKSNENINTNGHLTNHRNTLTNVTGADLAKEVKMIINQREGRAPKDSMTPNRLSFRAWKALKSSRAVANARNSAGELVFSPVRTVHNASQRAAKLVKKTHQKLKERKERRIQRRLARVKEPPPSWWIVIPADHPYKIAWDVLTMLWALLGAYRTHVRIRDRVFDQSPLIILTEVWFTIDVLLNFVTEHKTSKGQVIRDGKAVWARYLTTWFLIDILSLIPWERIYLRPLIEKIKKRNFFQKTFFRSKAVVRVSRVLRGRHIKLFGRVSKQTGTPLRKLVRLVIKYLPKYLVFLRNMKGALAVRALRFIHWLHNMYKKIWVKARNARRNLASRRSKGHPLFSPIRPSENNDSDSDSNDDEDSEDDMDDEDEDEELDEDNESLVEDEDDDGLVLIDTHDFSELTSFHRAHSDGSPLAASRRRAMSQNEIWLRD